MRFYKMRKKRKRSSENLRLKIKVFDFGRPIYKDNSSFDKGMEKFGEFCRNCLNEFGRGNLVRRDKHAQTGKKRQDEY